MKKSLYFLPALLLVISSTALQSCSKKGADVINDPITAPSGTAKKYLALGDSYTIGQGVTATERFPYLLVQGLRKENINIADPVYIAQTGWTTGSLQNAINTTAPPSNFDLVTLLIGVNDQYQRLDTGGYRTRFTELLRRAVTLAGGRTARVLVVSIPDYSATPFVSASNKPAVSREIDQFNAINRQVTEQHGVSYMDITPLTREAANDPSLLAQDGLHYAAKEHQLWVNLLLPKAKTVLQ
jgi:lysophospholipase L1-like esterase